MSGHTDISAMATEYRAADRTIIATVAPASIFAWATVIVAITIADIIAIAIGTNKI